MAPPVGGGSRGSSSLLLLCSDQHAQHRGGHADHHDHGYEQSVFPLPGFGIPPSHVGFQVGHVGIPPGHVGSQVGSQVGHVGIPPGHVGPETLERSLKVGLQCLHSFLQHGVLFLQLG